jgi:hypothetical protein
MASRRRSGVDSPVPVEGARQTRIVLNMAIIDALCD